MPLYVGSLVLEKWRNEWYMGQVTELETDAQDHKEQREATSSGGVSDAHRVKIHIHGEPETLDKWYDLPSPNVIELVQVRAKETAVGVFPQPGDSVELLVLDEPLAKMQHYDDHECDTVDPVLLTGTVQRVLPGRDASMVEVEYPLEYPLAVDRTRRVCVGNGYLRTRHRNEVPLKEASTNDTKAAVRNDGLDGDQFFGR